MLKTNPTARDFARSGDLTSYRLVNKGLDYNEILAYGTNSFPELMLKYRLYDH